MNRLNVDKKKFVVSAIFLLLILFCLIWHKRLNNYIGSWFPVKTVTLQVPDITETLSIIELKDGDILEQPITLDGRVTKLGIRIGTYARENTASYTFEVLSEEGVVLGKTVYNFQKFTDNNFFYIPIERITKEGTTCRLRITSQDIVPGNAVAFYLKDSENTEENYQINKVEKDKTLLLSYEYAVYQPYFIYITIFLMGCLLIYLFKDKFKRLFSIGKQFSIRFFAANGKKVVLVMMAILFIFIIAVCISPRKEYRVVYDANANKKYGQILELKSGQYYVQSLNVGNIKFDTLGLKFATYGKQLQTGNIGFEILNPQTNEILVQMAYPVTQIKDNQYSLLQFDSISGIEFEGLQFRIWLENMGDGEKLSLYYQDDNGSERYDYQLGNTENVINSKYLVMLIILEIFLAFWYLLQYGKINKKITVIGFCIYCGLLGGLFMHTYAVYHTLNFSAIGKTLGIIEGTNMALHYGERILKENRQEQMEYYADGMPHNAFISYYLDNIHLPVDTLTLYIDPDTFERVEQDIQIFYDIGEGYRKEDSYKNRITYRGEEIITVHISEEKPILSLRIDFGKNLMAETFHARGLEDNSIKYDAMFSVKSIGINVRKDKTAPAILFYVVSVLIVLSFYCWLVLLKNEKINRFIKRKLCMPIEKWFLLISLIFGLIILILVPVFQTPDEGYHINACYSSFGADGVYDSLLNATNDTNLGDIMTKGGIAVDKESYGELFFKKLDSYRFSFRPSLEMIKYPGQVIGAILALCLHLPVFWLCTLPEIGALIFYSVVGYHALKIIPKHKGLLMAIMLLPTALEIAGSFSRDSTNNIISFYFIAWILHLKYRQEKIRVLDCVKTVLLAFMLLYIKYVYVILALLILIIPINKFEIRFGKKELELQKLIKNKYVWISGATAFIAIFAIVLKMFPMLLNSGSQLLAAVRHPLDTFRIILATVAREGNNWLTGGIASFGWADTSVDSVYILLTLLYLVMLLLFECKITEKGDSLRKTDMAVLLTVLLGTFILVVMSMIEWTLKLEGGIVTDNTFSYIINIMGVQGRYFLPVIPLVCAISSSKQREGSVAFGHKLKYLLPFVNGCYFMVMVIYITKVITLRYWWG